jgi:hypothetical protein
MTQDSIQTGYLVLFGTNDTPTCRTDSHWPKPWGGMIAALLVASMPQKQVHFK